MSRVQINHGSITTIQEDESGPLSSHALAEHERQHPASHRPRRASVRRSTIDMSASDKSSDVAKKKLNKRALDVTRRLSMSSAMFHQLQNLMFMQAGGSEAGPGAKCENSYRMEPNEDEQFIPKEVSDIMDRALRQKLNDVSYNAQECAKLCCSLTRIIKTRLQENLDLPRYKLVVNVIIGERRQQSVQVASRCLWNDESDRCATSTYKNQTLYAVATVHGVYFD